MKASGTGQKERRSDMEVALFLRSKSRVARRRHLVLQHELSCPIQLMPSLEESGTAAFATRDTFPLGTELSILWSELLLQSNCAAPLPFPGYDLLFCGSGRMALSPLLNQRHKRYRILVPWRRGLS